MFDIIDARYNNEDHIYSFYFLGHRPIYYILKSVGEPFVNVREKH